MADRHFLEQLTKRLADEGKLIEAGWVGFRLRFVPPSVCAAQLDALRLAYLCGAQHLFASMITMLDPGTDETEADLGRMDLIAQEVEAITQELQLRAARSAGSG
jgi:hypothetical protein